MDIQKNLLETSQRDMRTMSQRKNEYASLEDELVTLLKHLLAELPPNVASLEVKRATPNGEGVIAVLTPQNPAAASVIAHTENGLGLVDFNFGEYGPTWELPIEGYNSKANKRELLQEVEDMCRAVIAGNCEHRRGLFSIRGNIQVSNHLYRMTDMLVFRPVPPLHGTRKYEPYIAGS
jgi:hypothetical protein